MVNLATRDFSISLTALEYKIIASLSINQNVAFLSCIQWDYSSTLHRRSKQHIFNSSPVDVAQAKRPFASIATAPTVSWYSSVALPSIWEWTAVLYFENAFPFILACSVTSSMGWSRIGKPISPANVRAPWVFRAQWSVSCMTHFASETGFEKCCTAITAPREPRFLKKNFSFM